MKAKGQLVCVGPGMILGAHISQRCIAHIKQADSVFVSCHPIIEQWIGTMNDNVSSLQGYYGKHKDRRITYQQMQDAMMEQVRAGKQVVGVFYGHPGVFAQVPHKTIAQAKQEGFDAVMEPGISAEDCLYADMGIDPGSVGSQHFEASQFMFYERKIDPSAYLILWQIALAGDLSLTTQLSSSQQREILVELLLASYPKEHQVALYECPFLQSDEPRIEWIRLDALPEADLKAITTLVIPPSRSLQPNKAVIARLRALEQQ